MPYDSVPTAPAVSDDKQSCKSIYDRMCTDRWSFLDRARLAAKLTIPWLVPPDGHNPSMELASPFQSVGARGVNNLTSKLLLALFPPNAPFFKYDVDPYALEQIEGAEENGESARAQVEQNLVKASEAILTDLATSGFRVGAYEAARHLVVAGNALQYRSKTGWRIYHLDQFGIERDPETDQVCEIVIKETLPPEGMPKWMLEKIATKPGYRPEARVKHYDLYTRAYFDHETKKWCVYQECEDMRVDERMEEYTEDTFPYTVLRGNVIGGENYGRGYVEEYIGDLLSLEGLSQAIVEGSAAAARITKLVNPAGMTDIDDLAKSENGAYVPGRADDVTTDQLQKHYDFQVTANTANAIEGRLSFAFLLNSAVQRNAERVTAEEIRYIAEELEQALGGIYTLLSKEWQLPLVRFTQQAMQKAKRLPSIPPKYIRPTVVTGIEALGRGNDLSRLGNAAQAFVAFTQAAAIIQPILKLPELAQRIFTAAGVRTNDLLKTPEELQAEQQAAQRQLMMEKLGPNVVNQVGGVIQQQQAAAQAPQQ